MQPEMACRMLQRGRGMCSSNPRFGVLRGRSLQSLFFQRAVREVGGRPGARARRGGVRQVLLLLKAAVGYGWFDAAYDWPHCFLSERVAFMEGGVAARRDNPHGSVAVYMGPNVARFCTVFSQAGRIPGHNAWSRV